MAPPGPRSPARRVLRIGLILLAAVVTLVVAAAVTLLLLVRSDWGREQVRVRVESALDDAFAGDASVGRVEGDLIGTTVLRDVVIRDAAGEPAITIDEVRVRLALPPLFRQEARIELLEAEGVRVLAIQDGQGEWNLASLLAKRKQAQAGAGDQQQRWLVDVRRFVVEDGSAVVRRPGGTTRIAALSASGALRVERDGGVVVPEAELEADGLVAALQSFSLDDSQLSGTMTLRLPARTLRRLWPESPISRDARVRLELHPVRGARLAYQVQLRAEIGRAVISGQLRLDGEAQRLTGTLELRDLDAADLLRDAPGLGGQASIDRATIEIDLALAEGEGDEPAGLLGLLRRLQAEIEARGAGSFFGIEAGSFTIELGAAGGSGELRFRGSGPGDSMLELEAELALERHRGANVLAIDAGRLRASAGSLAALVPGLPLTGAGAVDLRFEGRVGAGARTSLALRGSAQGRRIGWAGVVASSLQLSIDVTGLPSRPRGQARVTVEEVSEDGQPVGDLVLEARALGDDRVAVTARTRPATGGRWLVDLDAVADLNPRARDERVSIQLRRHRLITAGLEWRGNGGRIVVATDQLRLQELRSRVAGGLVSVDGRYDFAGPERGRAQGRLRLAGVDPAQVTRLFAPELPHHSLEGELDLQLELRPRTLAAQLDARLPRLGRARLDLELRPPARTTDAAAWQRLPRSAVRHARLDIDNVRVARTLRFFKSEMPLDGRVRAILALDDQGHVAAWLLLSVQELGRAEASAVLSLPPQPLSPQAWRASGADVVREARVEIDELDIDASRAARLGFDMRWRGRVSASAEAGPGLRSAHVVVDVPRLQAGRLAYPLIGRAEAWLDDDGLRAEVNGRIDGRWWLAIEANAPIDRLTELARLPEVPIQLAGRIIQWGGKAGDGSLHTRLDGRLAEPARLRAALVASDFQLESLAELMPGSLYGTTGILDADLRFDGRSARPGIDGTATIHDGRFPISPNIGTLREALLEVRIRGGSAWVEAAGRIGAGDAELNAHVSFDGVLPQSGEARLEVDDVSLISVLRPRVDGVMQARLARQRDGSLHVEAVVEDASVLLPEQKGRELHPVGVPDDIVFVNGGEPVPLAPAGATARATEAISTAREVTRRAAQAPAKPWLTATVRIGPTPVQSKEARAEVTGTLRVAIGGGRVALDGQLEASQGQVELFQRRYVVEQAMARFDGSTDPLLDVRLRHDFPELTLYVDVRGRASSPEVELSSDPALYSESQLLAYLVAGAPAGRPTGSLEEAATGAAISVLSQQLGGLVRKSLPVRLDVLRVERDLETGGQAFTVGKWLTNRLFIAYRRQLEAAPRENVSQAEIEYWLKNNLLLDATIGDRGVHGLDMLWIKRW